MVDTGGAIVDLVAAVVPVVPGGAGTAIKAARAVERADDAHDGLSKLAFARRLGEHVADIEANPANWKRVSAHAEEATRKGARKAGASVQEVFENRDNGTRIVRHTVLDDKGRVVEQHYRPDYKPPKGEVK